MRDTDSVRAPHGSYFRDVREKAGSVRRMRGRARERAKLAIRHGLVQFNLDIGRDPYVSRVVRTLGARNIDCVVDVGANVGQFATQLRHAGFRGRIVSVEPLSSAHAELARRASRDTQWETIRAAVGTGDGMQTVNVSANSYSSSLLPMTELHLSAAPGSQMIGTEEVPMIGIGDVMTRHGVDPARTLLKVDTQGFEGQVLDSAGTLLDDFAAIQLELSYVELYAGQPLHRQLTERLSDHGYVLWSLDTGISGQDGRLLQADGLFVREPE